jgi:hypothetical protein
MAGDSFAEVRKKIQNSKVGNSCSPIRKLRLLPSRREKDRVDQSRDGKQRAPPDIRVQIKKHHRIRRQISTPFTSNEIPMKNQIDMPSS